MKKVLYKKIEGFKEEICCDEGGYPLIICSARNIRIFLIYSIRDLMVKKQ